MIEAIRRELALGNVASARTALRKNWLRLIIESQTQKLEECALAFDDAYDPHLLLIRACCRDLVGDSYGAEFLRGQGLRLATDDFVVCFTDLLLAPDASTKGTVADRAHEALRRCGPEDDYSSALFLLGWTEARLRRDFGRGIALLRSAAEEARLQGRTETLRLAHSNLAFALTQAGLFAEAEQVLDALAPVSVPSDWDRFEGGLPQANRGCIAYWRGDYEGAVAHLDPAVTQGSPGNNFEALARLYLVMSLVALERKDRYHAAAELLRGISTADKHGVPWGTLRQVVSAWLAHAEGNDDRARVVAAAALKRPGAAVAHALVAALSSRLGDLAQAAEALRLSAASGLPRYARVSTLVTAAVLQSRAGQGEHAHELLERGLETAAPEGILAPFLSDDPLIEDLLVAHSHWGSRQPAFLQAVFVKRGQHAAVRDGVLTAREIEVLACLRTSMTAEEIASRLEVSYPTVKTHIRSIYRKLGVTTRRAAVQVAERG